MRSLHRNWRHREDVAEARELVAQKARIGALYVITVASFQSICNLLGWASEFPTLIR